MTGLTRRREPDRHEETWHIYHGDTRVGTIGERAGVPHDVYQWGWSVGFYPVSHRPEVRSPSGPAATFAEARDAFEAAWPSYHALCTEEDFAEERRHRATTAWKYRMHDTGAALPTATASGRSKCFCGAPLTIALIEAISRALT